MGPRNTAQVEAAYFWVTDTISRLHYGAVGGVSAPWAVAPATPSPASVASRLPLGAISTRTAVRPHATLTAPPASTVTAPPASTMTAPPASTMTAPPASNLPAAAFPPSAILPLLTPALPGEGQWLTLDQGQPAGSAPALAKAFLRPDPNRPYATVALLAMDPRHVRLHLVAGVAFPGAYGGGPPGPGVVPAADQQANVLLAAFNGGFKPSDGNYGMMVHGVTWGITHAGVGTVALYQDGSVRVGTWGQDLLPSASMIAYRQNGPLLVQNGVANPATQAPDWYIWGGTVLASSFTARSAIGVTASGMVIYAAGYDLSAATLAQTLLRAGVVNALELDINPGWIKCMVYYPSGATIVGQKLLPNMWIPWYEFIRPYNRDFFYVTRVN